VVKKDEKKGKEMIKELVWNYIHCQNVKSSHARNKRKIKKLIKENKNQRRHYF